MPRGDGTGPTGKGPLGGRGGGFNQGGAGRGRMGGRGCGPVGECLCPKCGTKTAHERGVPCMQQKCPQCGSLMMRALEKG